MNVLDLKNAMQVLRPAMRFGRDYLASIANGEVVFKVWNSASSQPTTEEIIAALTNHAPSLEERVAILEVNARTPIPVPQQPEWWDTSNQKFHPDIVGKPERTP